MSRTKITHLVCYDDHRTFTEDVRKRFSDETKYRIESFHTREEFLNHFRKIAENKSCKVAIIVVPDSAEQQESVIKLPPEVIISDPATGIILIVPAARMEEVRKAVKFNIDAYIPKNTNAMLRIHNEVKKLISEYNINVYRKRRNISLSILLAFAIITVLAVIMAYFRFPGYF
ncbi:MAG TPA: hypothetical protein PLB27_13490 [Bacteroidales bacterium]|nr:hypothetical protein [Bacteroidales bacterium]